MMLQCCGCARLFDSEDWNEEWRSIDGTNKGFVFACSQRCAEEWINKVFPRPMIKPLPPFPEPEPEPENYSTGKDSYYDSLDSSYDSQEAYRL